MTPDEQRALAIECGYADLPTVRLAYQGFNITAYTAAVEAKANARIAQLKQFIAENVYQDEKYDEIITESLDTWLIEHDNAVEVKVLKEVVAVESMFGWKGVLDAIEARK